jgi:hypothetical protein
MNERRKFTVMNISNPIYVPLFKFFFLNFGLIMLLKGEDSSLCRIALCLQTELKFNRNTAYYKRAL